MFAEEELPATPNHSVSGRQKSATSWFLPGDSGLDGSRGKTIALDAKLARAARFAATTSAMNAGSSSHVTRRDGDATFAGDAATLGFNAATLG